jgi:hypothetical protein
MMTNEELETIREFFKNVSSNEGLRMIRGSHEKHKKITTHGRRLIEATEKKESVVIYYKNDLILCAGIVMAELRLFIA